MGNLPKFNVNTNKADKNVTPSQETSQHSKPHVPTSQIPDSIKKNVPQLVPLPVDLAAEINQAEIEEIEKENRRHEETIEKIKELYKDIREFEQQKSQAIAKVKEETENDLKNIKEKIKDTSNNLANEIAEVINDYHETTEKMLKAINEKGGTN